MPVIKKSLSYIELSKSNLIWNLRQFRKLAHPKTKFSLVIKGNAYGHGLKEIISILNSEADSFQIDDIEELEYLRKFSSKKVFLLGYVQKSDLERALKLKCTLTVFSLEELKNINKIAGKLKLKQKIHLPVDALLGREGFFLKELPKLFKESKKLKNIKITGLYAHFANIEDTNNFTHAQKQIDLYQKAVQLAKSFEVNLETHISATSGLLVYEKGKGQNSTIRLGIGMYGLWPSEHIKFLYKGKMNLRPVLTWKTKIAQVKNLPAGSTIGYGLTYMTYKKTKIAVIPQGYADGLDRKLSNKGEVLIRGTVCKILGRVMMNMIVADVSHLKNVKEEDEVVIIGKQAKKEITVEQIAEKIGTINYEVISRISPLLPRIIVD